jgi:hypothetical protein
VLRSHRSTALSIPTKAARLGKTASKNELVGSDVDLSYRLASLALTVLVGGGCLCVPSDDDQKNVPEWSISSLYAKILDRTPSVARLLIPDRIAGVRLIIFAGEALQIAEARRW